MSLTKADVMSIRATVSTQPKVRQLWNGNCSLSLHILAFSCCSDVTIEWADQVHFSQHRTMI